MNTDSLKLICMHDGSRVGDFVTLKGTHSLAGLKYKITGVTDYGYEVSRYIIVKPEKTVREQKPYPVKNWWER